ncbi:MAG: DinB family protein [Anaerolineales bacterium]
MENFYLDYYDHLQELHVEIEQVLEGLPQAALDWQPGEGMNSLAVLAFHTAGAERYWFGDVIAAVSSNRDREAEFRTQGVDAETLKERLSASLSYCRSVLEKLSLEDLDKICVFPRDGRTFRMSWALDHALEHTATHLGHMHVTRQVWEQQQG